MLNHTLKLSAILLLAAAARAQEVPADLVPDSVGLYIQLDQLADLRAELAADPIAAGLRAQLPFARKPEAWQAVQQIMGLTGDQIVDRYFGRSLALISRDHKGGAASMLLSRVTPDDAALAVDRLRLAPTSKVGSFDAYRTTDGKANFAFSGDWMAIAATGPGSEFGRRILESLDPARSLSKDATFKTWTAKVAQEQSHVLVFSRDHAGDELTAISAARRGDRTTLRFAGQSADLDRLLIKRSDAAALDFGPLPARAVAAFTLNLRETTAQGRQTDLLDRVLQPHSFAKDVLPNLAAPIVAFAMPVERGENVAAPGLAIAIRLKLPGVAADLDKLVDRLVLFANLQTMQWKTDPIAITAASHGDVAYHVADFGTPISQRIDRPEIRPLLRLSYGRIGDWYLITTHDTVFTAAVDAAADPAKRAAAPALAALSLQPADQPILAAFVKAPESAALLRAFADLIKVTDADRTAADREKLLHALSVASGLLDHYRSLSLQFHQDDSRTVLGAASILRK